MNRKLPLLTLFTALSWIALYYAFIVGLGPEEKRHMLLTLGAHARAPVLEHGEVWRLLAAAFLHHSTFHLWSNVAGLLIIGFFLEPQVDRISLLALSFLSSVVPFADSVFLVDGVSVGGSVMVYGWAGAAFGYGFKKKALLKQKMFLGALLVYLGATLWIGLQSSGVAHRPHVVALTLGFVLGQHLLAAGSPKFFSSINAGALAAAVLLGIGGYYLKIFEPPVQHIRMENTGLIFDAPSLWVMERDDRTVQVANQTDAVAWAACQQESQPPTVEATVTSFLSGQLLWPQALGDVGNVEFEPGRLGMVPKEDAVRPGYTVPFSFLVANGQFAGTLQVWVFGLHRCWIVASQWRHARAKSVRQLDALRQSARFELSSTLRERLRKADASPEDGVLLLKAAELAFSLGEEETLQKLFEKLSQPNRQTLPGVALLKAKHALMTKKDVALARTWALQALEVSPDDREVVLLAAGLLLEGGEVARARQILMHAHILSGEFESWLEKTRWLKP